jgi:hypothetical protein
MRIVIDPARISLLLSSGFVGDANAIDLIIENAFAIRDGDGLTHTVNPAGVETLVPVLKLRLRPTLSLGESGRLLGSPVVGRCEASRSEA